MRRLFFASLLAVAATLGVLAQSRAEPPLNVVASFSIIGDMAKNVGGDRIDVTTLVGPNGDAHAYEPRPADAAQMARTDLVLVNGLHFEGFLSRLAETSGSGAPVVELANGVETIASGYGDQGDEAAHGDETGSADTDHAEDGNHAGHGTIDPHAFQSIPNAVVYVKNIADAFCAADAEGCGNYRANAAAYVEKLETLDAEIRRSVAAVPQDKRTVITSHDAFGYLGKEYGLRLLAPEGISTEAEASAADVAALIRQVREHEAAAVFVENVTNVRLIEQIASETGLSIGGTLYSDALSEADGPAATYIEMMRHNIETIVGTIEGS